MIGKIFITRKGYDPFLGKHVKDPYLGPNPSLGACRPDIRRSIKIGGHLFVISGKVPNVKQYVMTGFEVAAKMNATEAYLAFPEQRLQMRDDGQLTGNIIVAADGTQHELDDHRTFTTRLPNYIVGKNQIAPSTLKEVSIAREQTLDALCDILQKNGKSPWEVVGRFGSDLTEDQIHKLREWLTSLKNHQ